MKKLTFLTLVATLGLMMFGCGSTNPAADSAAAAGEIPTDLKPAPKYTLENIAGGTISSDGSSWVARSCGRGGLPKRSGNRARDMRFWRRSSIQR